MKKANEVQQKRKNEPEVKEEEKKKNEKHEDTEGEEAEDDYVAVIPPNGGWGWVVVLCAFYCNVVVDGIQLTFGIFLNAISSEFKSDNSLIVLAGSLMFGIHLLMGPVCSAFNSVFGLRPVTITGSVICSLGVGISYFANGFWYLCITFGLIGGMGLGLVYMNTLVITSLYFDSLLPIAIAIVVCGTGVGTMTFAAVGSFMLTLTTWQNSLLLEAVLAGTMGIAAISFRPLKPVKVKIMKEEKPTPDQPQRTVEDKGKEEERRSAAEPSNRRMSLFVKAEVINAGSIISFRNYQNIAASFVDAEREEHWRGLCCRKKKRKRGKENVLVLQEIPNDDPKSRRKSYVETHAKPEKEEEEEEELLVTERKRSGISNAVYTRFDISKKRNKIWGTLKRTISAMLDYRLLSSSSFTIMTVSGGTSLAAFLMVFIYEKDRCEDLGFSSQMSDIFVIFLGVVNVFWRLTLGMIAIIPKIRYRLLTITGMVIGGVAIAISGYSSNIYYQFAFCFLFGLGMASFAVFRMPLLLDLVGAEFLENAAGINLLFMGIFCIIFPPFFGWVQKVTNSYNLIFVINGSLLVASAFALLWLKKIDTTKIKRKPLPYSS